MAVVLPGKFCFLATPHTGSIAVDSVLRMIPQALSIRPHHSTLERLREGDVRQVRQNTGDGFRVLLDYQHHNRIQQMQPNQILKGGEIVCATHRNPYDSLTTWWLRRGRATDFKTFLTTYQDDLFVRNGRLHWFNGVERWLRWESLQDDLNAFLKTFDLGPVDLPLKNTTVGKKPWTEYYDADLYSVVNDRFGPEIEKFGYEIRTE